MSRFVLTAQLQLQAPNNIGQVVQQIQNQLQNVQVNVQVQGVQQANRQTRQLTSNLDAASDSANKLGRVFAVSVRRFTALAVATRAVSLFTNTLSGAIQEAIDFERELIKVSQVTGRALTELRDLTDTISNLSSGLGVSSQSLLQVTTILAQAGLNANDTKIALDTLAKSALAPNFDSLSETTEGAIAILAQFKQGVGALEAQLGSVDAVAGAFAVEAGDLIDVIRRAGGVFKSSGGSLNELIALFTSVRATTRESAESIGTGLRTIFTRIQRPKTIEFLKQFGVELVDLEGKFVGPFEAVRRLSGALAGLGEGDLTFIRVAEELGGFRQIGKVLPLLQQFTLAQEALNVAQEGGAGLAKNAISAQAALAIRITKVREEFLALVRSITETSSFQIMANTALNLASALIKIGEALKPILPLLGALAAIKVARGLGSFLGGIGSGLGSARGFNQGGKVLAFAKGGLVPGSGNKDTVPAMLTPGEFVMKKSAVESMGISNLKAMNRGGKASRKVDYEAGVGPSPFESAKSNRLGSEVYSLQKSSGLTPGEFEMAKRFADTNGYSLQEFKQYLAKRAQEKKNKSGLKTNTNDLLATLRGGEPQALSPENERLRVMLGGEPRRFAMGGTAKDAKQAQKQTDLPTGGPTEFTHIQSSSVNVPKNLQKYADQNGIGNIARLYTNMGLDLPKTWNRNWATNKKDFFGAFRDTLGTYIDNKDVFKTLRTGNKIYRFSGRGKSQAQNLLADNYEQIQDALAYNVLFSGDKFFDTDLDVDKIMPRLLSKSIREVLNDDAQKASALIKGFQETSAFKVQGVQGRQKTTIGMRELLNKSTGGVIQKFAFGGQARKFGIASLEGSEIQKTTTLPIDSITNRLSKTNQKNKSGLSNTVRGILGLKGQSGLSLTGQSDVLSLSDPQVKESIYNSIKNNIYGLVSESARNIGSALNIPLANRKQPINPNKLLNKIGTDSTMGSVFEGSLSLLGGPFVAAESGAALDFPRGMGRLGQVFTKVANMPVDAKKTSNDKNVSELLSTKAPNFFADFIQKDTRYKQFVSSESSGRLNKLRGTEFDLDTYKRVTGQSGATIKDLESVATLSRQSGNRKLFTLKNLGGIIQKFARGGIANAPLIDDIPNASNTIQPRPSLAIARLLQAGGGAVDIDRTIKRTIGDKAFGSAKTDSQKEAALQTYFRDDAARLRDVKTAPLTQFGQELQSVIKSGKLDGRKVSIISKSKRVPGVAEYLSQLFGIPASNMAFTSGQSKEPAMQAIRTKGPRVERVKNFFGGVIQKFARGGRSDPKDALESYFADSSSLNLGLANSKNLSKDQRAALASDVKSLRQLRTQAPATLYSSVSRVAFDRMASQIGFNKNVQMPEGTKSLDQEKVYSQEARKTIGRSFSLPGFVSTSKEFSKAKLFLDNGPRSEDNWAAMLTIGTKQNAQGIDVAQQLSGRNLNFTKQDINPRTGKMETMYMKPPSSEQEVMLQPRSRFKVNDARVIKLGSNKNLWANVQQFASGGVVPGSGNRDTVPAVLQQGDFVIRKSSVKKIGTDNLASMAGYATGGGVDKSVPALLTPGEFVFSREQAQSIGYGKLNRMNKVGKYATGGVVGVQKFARGTGASGATASPDYVSQALSFGKISLSPKDFALLQAALKKNTDIFNQLAPEIDQLKSDEVIAALKAFTRATNSASSEMDVISRTKDAIDASSNKMSIPGSTSQQIQSEKRGLDLNRKQERQERASGVSSGLYQTNKQNTQPNLLQKIDQEREKIEKENIQRLRKVFLDSYRDIKAAHDKAVQDAKDARASQAEIAAITQKANNAVKQLKDDTRGQAKASRQNAQAQAKSNVLQSDPNAVFLQAKQQAQQGVKLNASTQLGRDAYAKLTTAQLKQINAIQKATIASQKAAAGDDADAQASHRAAKADAAEASASSKSSGMFGGLGGGITLVSSALSTMLPPLDDSSSGLTRLGHSALGMITVLGSVVFALEQFGVSLTKQSIGNLLSGVGASKAGFAVKGAVEGGANILQSIGLPTLANGLSSLTLPLSKLTTVVVGAAGSIIAIAASAALVTYAFNSLISAMYNYDAQLKKAIEKGDTSKAGEVAGKKADLEGANVARGIGATAGAVTGAILGSSLGPLGTAVGAAIGATIGATIATAAANTIEYFLPGALDGLNVLFGGNTRASAVALAEAQAQAVKTSQALAEAQTTAEKAIKDFQDGTINAAQALDKVRVATQEVAVLQEKNQKAVDTNVGNKSEIGSGAIARNLGAYLGGGLFGMETAATRNSRIDAENAKLIEGQKASVLQANDIRKQVGLATARSSILASVSAGKSRDEIRQDVSNQLGDTGPQAIRQQAIAARQQAQQALKRGDTETADAFKAQADALSKQAQEYEQSIDNLIKEQERLEKSLKALNLGLRGPASTASAAASELEYFAAQIEGTALPAVNALALLEASVTSAGAIMDKGILAQATNDVADTLSTLGASADSITKFKAISGALNDAQSSFSDISKEIKSEQAASARQFTPQEVRDKFVEKLGSLADGLPPELQNQFKDIIGGIELTDEIKDQIARGDYSGIGDALGEQGKKFFEPLIKIAQDYQKAQQVLVNLTKERINAERNYVQAVKEAQDIMMEGREIQSKYGGKELTLDERRASVLTKANASNNLTGLGALRSASVADLNARSQEINKRFQQNQARINGGEGAGTVSGEQLRQQQQDLKQAQKDQVQTIRELIKLEEENLKLISEKNRLEKESVDSLLTGNIEKFFEQQAAVGATAAIASGDNRLASMFGGQALGAAAQDIRRQQEAGVQSLYGRQLGGAGGLTETAFGTALGAAGVTDPRLAQVAAGTTAEEEASKARLRDLGGALGEAGQLGADLAAIDVATATMNVANAEIKLQEVINRGREAGATFSQGGPVYASRGTLINFKPRGTDTVPAMLTPGEFVVRREAVNRGNNLQLLEAINNGSANVRSGNTEHFAQGGQVKYYRRGRLVQNMQNSGSGSVNIGIDPSVLTNFSASLDNFNKQLSQNISNLQNTKFQIALSPTNINVNLTGTSFLASLTETIKKDLITFVGEEIRNYAVGNDGRLRRSGSTLGTVT